MKRSGHTDLPLHGGKVPPWLYQRMSKLGIAIIEAIVMEYGRDEVLRRMSDPFWFQSFGCVLGMDWHSSGITTSVLGALKGPVNERSHELGLFFCGGRGKHSLKTPQELKQISEKHGFDGNSLIRSSRLSAKVDNTAIQDGFQLYLHSFILSTSGEWAVVQQGMNTDSKLARRYHWHSKNIKSFVEEPHTSVCGENMGLILNLTAKEAKGTKDSVLSLIREEPRHLDKEIKKLIMPFHHDVRNKDVNMKRLGSIIALAETADKSTFENLLLIKGLGPRTLQSLTLVSEVIYGTPSRFKDPARFSFAHGGKDGYPHPVPTKVYDQSINTLENAINKAKIGFSDRKKALQQLHKSAMRIEKDFIPTENVEKLIQKEKDMSHHYGGMTVFGPSRPKANKNGQLGLFD
ncbi:MAG: DUF763 domain-containing protein [Candidatus Cyclobacteriaceae bacterium M2_1C_046]